MAEQTIGSSKKLAENVLSDLRLLSEEARKKYPQIKEAAETCGERIRNIAGGGISDAEFTNALAKASTEVLHPFVMGCDSKNHRMVQISLVALQRLTVHHAIDENGARAVMSELAILADAGIEELKVLQTITHLLSQQNLVRGPVVAKGLVTCFRLHLSGKDPVLSNTASATVRQLVGLVFEKALAEANSDTGEKLTVAEIRDVQCAISTLGPYAKDAFFLFQDICLLLSHDHKPAWLVGLHKIPVNLGLDLLESFLVDFTALFHKRAEFAFLLKEQVCPLVIRLFSPSLKHMPISANAQGSLATSQTRVSFPMTMRLMRLIAVLVTKCFGIVTTECEIFISLILKFLDADKSQWQQALALEVLHKMSVQPELLKHCCESFDMRSHSTKILKEMVTSISAYAEGALISASKSDLNNEQSATPSGSTPGGGQPGFCHKGTVKPVLLMPTAGSGATVKNLYLEMRDKMEPLPVPDGYTLSMSYASLVDATHSLNVIVQQQQGGVKTEQQPPLDTQHKALMQQLMQSMHGSLLEGVVCLLDACLDEVVTEILVKCVLILVRVSCTLEMETERDASLCALCRLSLPSAELFVSLVIGRKELPSVVTKLAPMCDADANLNQIVLYGSPCPTPTANLSAHTFSITTKNIRCLKALLEATAQLASHVGPSWYLVLSTLQQASWMLRLNPAEAAGVSGAAGKDNQITAYAMAEIPVVQAMIGKVFQATRNLNDVGLHHVLHALCRLTSDAMTMAVQNKDPSFFALHRLLETGLINLTRLTVFWKPMTAHILEVCTVQHSRLRAEGVNALVTLVRSALRFGQASADEHGEQEKKEEGGSGDSVEKLTRFKFRPIVELSEINHEDVRMAQMETTLGVIREHATESPTLWEDALGVIGSIALPGNKFSDTLVQKGFENIQLVVTDYLASQSTDCLRQVIEVCGKYGFQKVDFNVSLTAVGLLWNISDHLFRSNSTKGSDSLWLCLFTCLSELCVDARPPVRKSASQTLFQTINSHGSLLSQEGWNLVLWQVLFPLLDKVKSLWCAASTARGDSGALGGQNILIHHSRDTESKQWAETRVLTLGGVAKVFASERKTILSLDSYEKSWQRIFDCIEESGQTDSHEIALAALKAMQDLLGLTTSIHLTSAAMRRTPPEDAGLQLSSADWLVAWKAWLRIAEKTVTPPPRLEAPSRTATSYQLLLTTLLQSLPVLMPHLQPQDLNAVMRVLFQVALLSVSHADLSAAFYCTPASAFPDMSATQAAVLDCVNSLYELSSPPKSLLRQQLPAVLRLVGSFVTFGCSLPRDLTFPVSPKKDGKSPEQDFKNLAISSFVSFSHQAITMVTSFYLATATVREVIIDGVLKELIQVLHIPLALRYKCPCQATWQLALSALLSMLRVGLPVARSHPEQFSGMWPELAATINDYLFPKETPTLTPQEASDHEQLDMQVIEMLKVDVLSHAASVPEPFVNKIIQLLHSGSIQPGDGGDGFDVDTPPSLREELARCCFNTLLHFAYPPPDVLASAVPSTLGSKAVASLLTRCASVLEAMQHDSRSMVDMPFPRHRVVEAINALSALSTLIESFQPTSRNNTVRDDLWEQVISLYPMVVNCLNVDCEQLHKPLVNTLHVYRLLLRPPS